MCLAPRRLQCRTMIWCRAHRSYAHASRRKEFVRCHLGAVIPSCSLSLSGSTWASRRKRSSCGTFTSARSVVLQKGGGSRHRLRASAGGAGRGGWTCMWEGRAVGPSFLRSRTHHPRRRRRREPHSRAAVYSGRTRAAFRCVHATPSRCVGGVRLKSNVTQVVGREPGGRDAQKQEPQIPVGRVSLFAASARVEETGECSSCSEKTERPRPSSSERERRGCAGFPRVDDILCQLRVCLQCCAAVCGL